MQRKVEEIGREFNGIVEYVTKKSPGKEIHEVETEIHAMVLKLGRSFLELSVEANGTGKIGEAVVGDDGAEYRYLRNRARKYKSIFGEISIRRAYYWTEGRKGLYPLDATLNLPDRMYSYALQDRMAWEAVKDSYQSATASLKKHLCLEVAHRPIQRVVHDCTGAVEEFMESLGPPPVQEEGTILVHSVDCKGVRMRPQDRNPNLVKTKDKPGEKQMACVARTYSIFPHFRSDEVIVASFFGGGRSKPDTNKDPRRPKPLNMRTFVSLKRKKREIFESSGRSATARIQAGTEEKLALMDGEKVLWRWSHEFLQGWRESLDLTHVVGKLRAGGEIHYGTGPDAEEYAKERTEFLLQGRVDDLIEDLQISLEDGSLSCSGAAELKSKVVGYIQRNRHRTRYDQLLEKGLPVSTGIIESTCNCLINTRMEGAGMFWSRDGAEAMLKLRGVFLDDLWEEFWGFRAKSERNRLYAKYDSIRPVNQEDRHTRQAA